MVVGQFGNFLMSYKHLEKKNWPINIVVVIGLVILNWTSWTFNLVRFLELPVTGYDEFIE